MIKSIEIESSASYCVVTYKSGAVRWYTRDQIPQTVRKAIRTAATDPHAVLSKVVRPFVSGDGKKTPYTFKECAFASIEYI